jgi:hypothetical protein
MTDRAGRTDRAAWRVTDPASVGDRGWSRPQEQTSRTPKAAISRPGRDLTVHLPEGECQDVTHVFFTSTFLVFPPIFLGKGVRIYDLPQINQHLMVDKNISKQLEPYWTSVVQYIEH